MKAFVIRLVMVALAFAFATAAYAQSGHGSGRGGREGRVGQLSSDERKALRHDIVQHGRDHYRSPQPPAQPIVPTGGNARGGSPGGPPDGHRQHRNR